MKKSELIALLAQYPDDMEVYVRGYEGGWDALTGVERRRIAPAVNPVAPWLRRDKWSGEFDDNESGAESIVIV